MLGDAPFLSTPRPEVALAWGSKSHSSTRFPWAQRVAVRLTVVVVLAHAALLVDHCDDSGHVLPPKFGKGLTLYKYRKQQAFT